MANGTSVNSRQNYLALFFLYFQNDFFFNLNSKYEEAMQAVTGPNARELKCHSLLQVGRTYLDFLLTKGEFQAAARLCVNILGIDFFFTISKKV